MSTIFERIEKRLKKIEKEKERILMRELIHKRVEELYRGKDFFEKLKGILKIISA